MNQSINAQLSSLKNKMKNIFYRKKADGAKDTPRSTVGDLRKSRNTLKDTSFASQISAINLSENMIVCPLHAEEDEDQYFCITCLATFCLGCSNAHQMHSICPINELKSTVLGEISYLSQKITEFIIGFKSIDKLPDFTLEKLWDMKQIEGARKSMHAAVDSFFDRFKSLYTSSFNEVASKEKEKSLGESLKRMLADLQLIEKAIAESAMSFSVESPGLEDLELIRCFYNNKFNEKVSACIKDYERLQYLSKSDDGKYTFPLSLVVNRDYLTKLEEEMVNFIYIQSNGKQNLSKLSITSPDYFECEKILLPLEVCSQTPSDLILYDLKAKCCVRAKQELKAEPSKLPLGATFLASPKGEIYLTGGFSGAETSEPSDKVWLLRPNTLIFKPLAPMLDRRAQHSLVWLNGFLYAVGGVSDEGKVTDRCEIYDPRRNKWMRIASLKTPRKSPSLCSFNDETIYAFGGESEKAQSADESLMFGANQTLAEDLQQILTMKKKSFKQKTKIFPNDSVLGELSLNVSQNKENFDSINLNTSMSYRETVILPLDQSPEPAGKRNKTYIERYCPDTNKWEPLFPLNFKDSLCYENISSIQINFNEILLFGGHDSESFNKRGFLYNFKKNSFTLLNRVSELPIYKKHPPILFNNSIFVVGDFPQTLSSNDIPTKILFELGKKEKMDCLDVFKAS